MTPGPNLIYQCLKCNNLLFIGSLTSGNTFGAELFSDGKQIGPMLPDFPDITKCPKCKTIFWISDENEIGSFEPWGLEIIKEEWKNAQKAKFLSVYEYFTALDNKILRTKNDEILIRQRIWWGFNDRLRKKKSVLATETDETLWFNNINVLLTMLDPEDTNQLIMMAELNRNLGNFEKCIAILDCIETNDLDWLKVAFKKECDNKKTEVFQLT